jgi:hypothetical protein
MHCLREKEHRGLVQKEGLLPATNSAATSYEEDLEADPSAEVEG